LLIILGFSSVWALSIADGKRKVKYMGFAALTLLAVFWTFSRAAWIGGAVTLLVVGYFMAVRQRFRVQTYKFPIIIAGAMLLLLGASGLYVFRDTYLVKNVVFHADEATVLEDPNELRLRFWQESFGDIADEPLGSGPGTAGLASIRNDERTVLNENYYLQTTQETGIIGLILFLAILFIVALRLYDSAKTQNLVAIALLASLAGLIITNLLAHIWANEAVAYTWWSLAGLALATPNKKSAKSS
jgi:O-antigen ligase